MPAPRPHLYPHPWIRSAEVHTQIGGIPIIPIAEVYIYGAMRRHIYMYWTGELPRRIRILVDAMVGQDHVVEAAGHEHIPMAHYIHMSHNPLHANIYPITIGDHLYMQSVINYSAGFVPKVYHKTHQPSTCNTPVQYMQHTNSVHNPIQHTSPVHTTHQSSTYNTPVQYIHHTSPVHTTHQSSTYNTLVQYIQHTSPVHATHQSSTYNTTIQYIHHTSPVHTTPVQYIQHTSPVHQSSTFNTPVQYILHTRLGQSCADEIEE